MATLHLAVQYASVLDAPRRDQVRRWVGAALRAADVASARLTVRFVDADEGRALNRQYRGKDYATNVLTFAYPDPEGSIEGDVVVCLPVVEAEARDQSKDALRHCAHLVIHGTLHAAGHDHEDATQAESMEAIERDVLARFGIDDPYRIADVQPPGAIATS